MPVAKFGVIIEGSDLKVQDFIRDADVSKAANTGLALLKLRIVRDGKLATGESMPGYSTDKIYIPVAGVGTGPPFAKPKGGTLSRTGKSMVFPDGEGYKGFRLKAGRGARMNMTLSGNMMGKRFRVLSVSGRLAKVGWPAGSDSALAAAGQDQRFEGELFAWSEKEQEAMIQSLKGSILANMKAAGFPMSPDDLKVISEANKA
jgi:hypothetical protein